MCLQSLQMVPTYSLPNLVSNKFITHPLTEAFKGAGGGGGGASGRIAVAMSVISDCLTPGRLGKMSLSNFS